MRMLKVIKFFIWMGKELVLKELHGLVHVAEMGAFNNSRLASEHKDSRNNVFYEGKASAYCDVLETINMIMEREKNGHNKEN